jgi:hypothetical protein
MSKRKLGILVIAVMIVGAIVPALIPNGCAPLPFDCYVIWVYPDSP